MIPLSQPGPQLLGYFSLLSFKFKGTREITGIL
jgi:hypothetical protein